MRSQVAKNVMQAGSRILATSSQSRNITYISCCVDPRCTKNLGDQTTKGNNEAYVSRSLAGQLNDSLPFLLKRTGDKQNEVIQNTHDDCQALTAVAESLRSKDPSDLTDDLKDVYKYTLTKMVSDKKFNNTYKSLDSTRKEADMIAKEIVPEMSRKTIKKIEDNLGTEISFKHKHLEIPDAAGQSR